MWILPKQLHTSAYVPDTAALSLDLSELSQLCAASLFVRSKPSLLRTWSLKWKRDSWTQHLFGRILRPSLGQRFETAWTSSLEATHASHSQQQENDLEGKTLGICGRISQEAFQFFNQESASLKTSRATLPAGCITFCATWEDWVTERRGAYSQRLNAVRHTSESECSSWPTANARDWKDGSAECNQRAMDAGHQVTLARAATCWSTPSTMMGAMYAESNMEKRNSPSLASQVAMWPTPTTAEAGKISCCPNYGQLGLSNHPDVHGYQVNRPKLEKSRPGHPAPESSSTDGSRPESWQTAIVLTDKLDQQVKTWATPRACEWKGGNMTTQAAIDREVAHNNLVGQVAVRPNSGKLNSRWVEILMNLPVGWTMPSCASPVTIERMSSASSATELCQQPPL